MAEGVVATEMQRAGGLLSVERALRDLARGRFVVVLDDDDREGEADLVLAAEHATPEALGFLLQHTSGIVCAAMEGAVADSLELPPMVEEATEHHGTAFTVSVDARDGVTTGISPDDRARTLRCLADRRTYPNQLVRPGHVFPLRARAGGVLERRGHTEAGVDLARLSGVRPVAAICELTTPRGVPLTGQEGREFAEAHGLVAITVEDLVGYRRVRGAQVRRAASAELPTAHGRFTAHVYVDPTLGVEHVALVHGDVAARPEVLVRVHSECATGDIFGSLRCDCRDQLDAAMRQIVQDGAGVVVYLRGHEGRGIGLQRKLAAYELQQEGYDTVDANRALGLPIDARRFEIAAHVLADLAVRHVRLLTNNPAKVAALRAAAVVDVQRHPIAVPVRDENERYLATKHRRLGHAAADDAPTVDGGVEPHRELQPLQPSAVSA
jgi:3,4-dihydroxy 2-butanone 4-phosphate synthase / GTP cyclohydrolase II